MTTRHSNLIGSWVCNQRQINKKDALNSIETAPPFFLHGRQVEKNNSILKQSTSETQQMELVESEKLLDLVVLEVGT